MLQGCTVYKDRPVSCRYYPLGLAAVKMKGHDKPEDFYFLVRERPLAPEEVNLYYGWKALQGPAHISPNHEAVLATLRGLTGMYAPNATAQAWREALRLK